MYKIERTPDGNTMEEWESFEKRINDLAEKAYRIVYVTDKFVVLSRT